MPGSFEELDDAARDRGHQMLLAFKDKLLVQNAEEKLQREVAALPNVADHTTVPIPLVLHHGTREECPDQLGPFLIEDWVTNGGDVADVLTTPALAAARLPPELNPDVETATLGRMYAQMAEVLLQLARPSFGRIGALGIVTGNECGDDGGGNTIDVVRRPLSFNLSQLANFARVPHFALPAVETTYATSPAHHVALADMHLQQLSFQRNKAADSAADCRKKYIAR